MKKRKEKDDESLDYTSPVTTSDILGSVSARVGCSATIRLRNVGRHGAKFEKIVKEEETHQPVANIWGPDGLINKFFFFFKLTGIVTMNPAVNEKKRRRKGIFPVKSAIGLMRPRGRMDARRGSRGCFFSPALSSFLLHPFH